MSWDISWVVDVDSGFVLEQDRLKLITIRLNAISACSSGTSQTDAAADGEAGDAASDDFPPRHGLKCEEFLMMTCLF